MPNSSYKYKKNKKPDRSHGEALMITCRNPVNL